MDRENLQALFRVSLKPFEPLTAADNGPERKKALLKSILEKQDDLDAIRQNCRGMKVFVDVRFSLFNNTTAQGRYQKDLDNLLKIVLDVLQEKVDKTDNSVAGLGLIKDDLDIVRIHCSKSFVQTEDNGGIDITLYDDTLAKTEFTETKDD
jgi:hypothetical protein